jgi:hypothetical protein
MEGARCGCGRRGRGVAWRWLCGNGADDIRATAVGVELTVDRSVGPRAMVLPVVPELGGVEPGGVAAVAGRGAIVGERGILDGVEGQARGGCGCVSDRSLPPTCPFVATGRCGSSWHRWWRRGGRGSPASWRRARVCQGCRAHSSVVRVLHVRWLLHDIC